MSKSIYTMDLAVTQQLSEKFLPSPVKVKSKKTQRDSTMSDMSSWLTSNARRSVSSMPRRQGSIVNSSLGDEPVEKTTETHQKFLPWSEVDSPIKKLRNLKLVTSGQSRRARTAEDLEKEEEEQEKKMSKLKRMGSQPELAIDEEKDEINLTSICCGLTRMVMRDPVMASDGHTYERKSLEEWFKDGNISSPVLKEPLKNQEMVPNVELRRLCFRYHQPKTSGLSKDTCLLKEGIDVKLDTQPFQRASRFGQMFRALLNHTPVAVKVFTVEKTNESFLRTLKYEMMSLVHIKKHPNLLVHFGYTLHSPKHSLVERLMPDAEEETVTMFVASFEEDKRSTHYGAVMDVPKFGLVQELVTHGSLSDLLRNKGADLPWWNRIQIAKDIAEGLHHLHELGHVHGNLSSSNVLITEDLRARLCDYGLSRTRQELYLMRKDMLKKKGGAKSVTAANTSSYSSDEDDLPSHEVNGYTPPEWVVSGENSIFQRVFKTDIYQVGMVYYEIATGKRPFADVDPLHLPMAIAEGERPEIPEGVPRSFQRLFCYCWSQLPSQRPTTKELVGRIRPMPTGAPLGVDTTPVQHEFSAIPKERIIESISHMASLSLPQALAAVKLACAQEDLDGVQALYQAKAVNLSSELENVTLFDICWEEGFMRAFSWLIELAGRVPNEKRPDMVHVLVHSQKRLMDNKEIPEEKKQPFLTRYMQFWRMHGSNFRTSTEIRQKEDELEAAMKRMEEKRQKTKGRATKELKGPLKADRPDLLKLLHHVAFGEQRAADDLLRENPSLAVGVASVVDPVGRRFENITAFQYAIWALDNDMAEMILEYLPLSQAAKQQHQLEHRGTKYGRHYQPHHVVSAYEEYERRYPEYAGKNQWSEVSELFMKTVGHSQKSMPAHFIQEICHPLRAFIPLPSFKELSLTGKGRRSLQFDEGNNVLSSIVYGGKLGDTFALIRGASPVALAVSSYHRPQLEDMSAIASLCKWRVKQYVELAGQLLTAGGKPSSIRW